MTSTLLYVLLSPTFGMHQYTADLAHQAVAAGYSVHVVTTAAAPRDRYAADVHLHTPIAQRSTGFAGEGARLDGVARVWRQIVALRPDVVHFTGVHLWNPLLLALLRARGVATVHTLHDLDPHPDVRFGRLIRLWNQLVVAGAGRLLVHAERYRQRLSAQRGAAQLHAWPLTHTFLGAAAEAMLTTAPPPRTWEPWVLFFGRVEAYKGVAVLLAAAQRQTGALPSVVLAGRSGAALGALPPGVIHLNRHVDDGLGWELFRRCRAVVLPYTGATQSALPAAAYAFGKPVIVSDSGALAESVSAGRTGWVTPAGDAAALAAALTDVRERTPATLAALGDAGRAWRTAARTHAQGQMAALYAAATG
jgi:glycosyltransferase involved in cell wall biosynthesis